MNLKKHFPFFKQHPEVVYLDNAATTHKPQQVIDAMSHFYTHEYATVGRSIYSFAEHATQRIEDVRSSIAHFIGAQSHEIVFTKGATEGINTLAWSWGMDHLTSNDEILLTQMEHHSNLLPWLELARRTGVHIRYIPVLADGTLDYSQLDALITSKTKLVSLVMVSNALGTHNDVARIVAAAHAVGAFVMVDAAQAVGHMPVKVDALGADALVFSGHKIYGPTGVGILYIRSSWHEQLQPYHVGGGMVFEADFDSATYLIMPHKLEAGTPAIAEIIGLGAAISFIEDHINLDAIAAYEASLTSQLITGLAGIDKVRMLGPLEQLKKSGHMVSFVVEGYHPHDIGAYLDNQHILVRAGHFCAQPLAKKLGIVGAIRASFACYSEPEDVDSLVRALASLIQYN